MSEPRLTNYEHDCGKTVYRVTDRGALFCPRCRVQPPSYEVTER